jgi:hypothetical protein
MRGIRVVVISLSLVACGGGVTVSDAGGGCLAAFERAAGVGEMVDTVSDLYPAVRACESVAAWAAGFAAVEGAGFSGSAEEVLRNVCLADELAGEQLCAAVQ